MNPITAFLCCLMAASAVGDAQISYITVTPTATQAVMQYLSPVDQACGLKVADMNRNLVILSASGSGGGVTVTTAAPHGLLKGAVVYLQGTGTAGWEGWQTVTSVLGTVRFNFASTVSGNASAGIVGVLIDDVNPALYPGADQDSRPGNLIDILGSGRSAITGPRGPQTSPTQWNRFFVIGHRTADIAADGNRYSRALQVNSPHHYTLTCGTQSLDGQFQTQNLPLGNTYNEGLPVDRAHPGQYAYPTVQWSNQAQALIDPLTGLRSFRATQPTGTPSGPQKFQAALDRSGAWNNPSGPLNSGGGASFAGPCAAGTCALFFRADSLSLSGGATYATGYANAASLDWVTVTIAGASISNPSCNGDDCKMAVCLTVNGVSCSTASHDIPLTAQASTYTAGSGSMMDLWQSSGPPTITRADVSQASGTVNYKAANAAVTWTGGNKFSIKWTPGSRIAIAGTEYAIAAVQNENALTLTGGPASDLTGVPFTANNFGVLLWKKTAAGDRLTVGYTTFQYGSSPFPGWDSSAVSVCSRTMVNNAAGAPGYNCFISQELYWIAADGSVVNDLGQIATQWVQTGYPGTGESFWGNTVCGTSSTPAQFDPLNGDRWYCVMSSHIDHMSSEVVQAQYMGDHGPGTPGQTIASCDVDAQLKYNPNANPSPCLRFVLMMPNGADMLINGPSLTNTGPGNFSADYVKTTAAPGYYWLMAGISSDGYLRVFSRTIQGQNSPGWFAVYSLGDGTPVGTGANSMKLVAVAAGFATAPFRWCGTHSFEPPTPGWLGFDGDPTGSLGSPGAFTVALAGGMSATPGACPPNPFGVTGNGCSDIAIAASQPARAGDGATLGGLAPGDVILVDSENLRVMTVTDALHINVQRSYLYGSPASHVPGAALVMQCGLENRFEGQTGYWDFIHDPLGKNQSGNTMVSDPNELGSHHGGNDTVEINAGTGAYDIGDALCPVAILTPGPGCYIVRFGAGITLANSPMMTVANNPPFAGKVGKGFVNEVDSHPGSCVGQWCLDARPMDGGPTGAVGSAQSPFVNVTGQLWQNAGGSAALNRKFLTTMAYAGRTPLIDISGPGSRIATDATGSYQYCYALTAGECRAGSTAGSVYVNTPFVSVPYCSYPGIAYQPDDTNAICIADLGAYTGVLVQVGVASQDFYGALSRRLGPAYSRWNEQSVYWNVVTPPNGSVIFSQVLWLDGVRSEDLATIMPPYPTASTAARGGFIATPVDIAPPGVAGGVSAIVEFGYAEYGDAGSFFCSSRQEACVAVTGAVDASNPYYYEKAESYISMPCAQGCTVALPALPQHILYYRAKFLDASGQVAGTGQTFAVAVP